MATYAELQAALQREHEHWKATGESRTAESTRLRNWWAGYQAPAPAPPPAPPPPPPPPPKGQDAITANVRVGDTNIVTWTKTDMSVSQLEELYFQDVGGTEILAVARHDNINGEETAYRYLGNVNELQMQFNSLNLMLNNDIRNIFNKFAIDMSKRIPDLEAAVESDTTGFVVYLDSVNEDEYVQLEVATQHELIQLEVNP